MSGEDAADPATGLTDREKQAVRDTWAIVKQDIKTHAYGIFVRFVIYFLPLSPRKQIDCT